MQVHRTKYQEAAYSTCTCAARYSDSASQACGRERCTSTGHTTRRSSRTRSPAIGKLRDRVAGLSGPLRSRTKPPCPECSRFMCVVSHAFARIASHASVDFACLHACKFVCRISAAVPCRRGPMAVWLCHLEVTAGHGCARKRCRSRSDSRAARMHLELMCMAILAALIRRSSPCNLLNCLHFACDLWHMCMHAI